jgi:hypothetical protein
MRTHRFGQKLKLPATIAIKHQLRKLMFEDALKKAEQESNRNGSESVQLRSVTQQRRRVHSIGGGSRHFGT